MKKESKKLKRGLEVLPALLAAFLIIWQFSQLVTRSEENFSRYEQDILRNVPERETYGEQRLDRAVCTELSALLPSKWCGSKNGFVQGFFPDKAGTGGGKELQASVLYELIHKIRARLDTHGNNYDALMADLREDWQIVSESYTLEAEALAARKEVPWYRWQSIVEYFQKMRQSRQEARELRRAAIFQQEMRRNQTMRDTREALAQYYLADENGLQGVLQPAFDQLEQIRTGLESESLSHDYKESARSLYRLAVLIEGRSVPRLGADEAGPWSVPEKTWESRVRRVCQRLLVAPVMAGKANRVLEIVPRAGITFGVWTLALLFCLALARKRAPVLRISGMVIPVWLAVGYVTGVALPAIWYMAGAGLTVALWLAHDILARLSSDTFRSWLYGFASRPVSPWLLPGWILFVGTGLLVIADISVNFHYRNRFLFLKHYDAVFWGMVLLSLAALWAPQLLAIARRCIAALNFFSYWAREAWARAARLEAALAWLPPLLICLALPCLAVIMPGKDYLTGEFYKIAFLFITSWYLMTRAHAFGSASIRGKILIFLPLLAPISAIAAGLLLSRDMGPLLVILMTLLVVFLSYYGLRAIVAGLVSVIGAIFVAGHYISVVAQRLDSTRNPFASHNEHLAKLLWFQAEAPLWGFGVGWTPWCGYSGGCGALPLQLQSDYTFTALRGIYGLLGWLAPILLIAWVILLQKSWALSSRANHATPLPGRFGGQYRVWLANIFGIMLILQTMITIAGNVGRLPITGITFPFISFGGYALLSLTFVLALLLNREEEVTV